MSRAPLPLPLPSLAHLTEAAVRPVFLRLESKLRERHSWGSMQGQGFARSYEEDFHYLDLERSREQEHLLIGLHVRVSSDGHALSASVRLLDSGRTLFEHPRLIHVPATSDDFEVASEARTLALSLSDWVLSESSLTSAG